MKAVSFDANTDLSHIDVHFSGLPNDTSWRRSSCTCPLRWLRGRFVTVTRSRHSHSSAETANSQKRRRNYLILDRCLTANSSAARYARPGSGGHSMVKGNLWDDPITSGEMLPASDKPLTNDQLKTLWSVFKGITEYWALDFNVELIHRRWLDMIQARCSGDPDYSGEYVNAVNVYKALDKHFHRAGALVMIYEKTIVTDDDKPSTRLEHAKRFVINDFIRCFIINGGYRGFVPNALNYTGYMGGSRYQEWDPVRTGGRK
jgi:hypothetical protein